ncbi:metallophosphoesterase [Mesorhizobium sp. M1312]|uniref:metallophosphoesterase family protein n=1 Tax=unclassified Mesorhizobium TaxID=325217 RepID=UPI00333BD656
MSFRIAITSDPQYPWYDGDKDANGNITQQGYPPDLFDEAAWSQSSKEQILGQYAAITRDANAAGKDPIAAVIINGDLTSTGLDTELQVWSDAFETLRVPAYPALGNHDYCNYVDDSFNNNRASRMVDWMWAWLQNNRTKLRSVDFSETGFGLPLGAKTFTGSLAYSFNLGSVHCVMLHNYPFYTRKWHYQIATGGQRNYIITSSWDWLVEDLAHARQRGDAIFVFTHAYSDDQFKPGAALDQFRSLMSQTGVSAVFAGHIHKDCKLIDTIGPGGIPVFRSGAGSQQNFLMLDISFEPSPTFTVSVLDSKTVPPSNDKQNYVPTLIYPPGTLNVVVGEMAIVGGRMNVGDSNYAPGSIHDDPECAWGIQGTAEKTLGHGFGLNSADKRVVADPSDPSGSCYLMAQVQAADAVQDGTMVVTGGYVADTKGGSALANTQWGSPSGRTQLAAKLWTWMKDKDQYAYLYFWVAPWGAPDSKPFVVTGGEQVLWEATSTRKLGQDTPWGYQGRNSKAVQIAHARTFIDGVHRPMSYFTLYPAQP